MHARHYGVVTGRFLSIDRVEGDPKEPRSWNRYSYTLSNPIKYVDPDGQTVRCPPSGCHEPATWLEKVEQGFRLASLLPSPMAMAAGPKAGAGLVSQIGQLLNKVLGGADEAVNINRALTAADLGLKGTVNEVSGTFSVAKGLATVKVDMTMRWSKTHSRSSAAS